MKESDLLVGWKEIASMMGDGVKTTRKKYRESLKKADEARKKDPNDPGDAMPIVYNGRYKAFRHELKAWMDRNWLID